MSLNFWSGKNYLKRDISSGSASMAAPATSAYGGTLFITQLTIPHTLNQIPMFNVYYEPFKDGVLWEPLATRSQSSAINPRNTAQTGPYSIAWPSSTGLTIEIGYSSNSLTGTYPVYYVIYRDYAIT